MASCNTNIPKSFSELARRAPEYLVSYTLYTYQLLRFQKVTCNASRLGKDRKLQQPIIRHEKKKSTKPDRILLEHVWFEHRLRRN
jgi:hypothetical protein